MESVLDQTDWKSALAGRHGDLPDIVRVGCSVIHRRTGIVEQPAGKSYLRPMELELLLHLYRHATVTLTRQDLLHDVWNFTATLLTRTVDQTVATLRQKIEVTPEQPKLLLTVYGIGYRLML